MRLALVTSCRRIFHGHTQSSSGVPVIGGERDGTPQPGEAADARATLIHDTEGETRRASSPPDAGRHLGAESGHTEGALKAFSPASSRASAVSRRNRTSGEDATSSRAFNRRSSPHRWSVGGRSPPPHPPPADDHP